MSSCHGLKAASPTVILLLVSGPENRREHPRLGTAESAISLENSDEPEGMGAAGQAWLPRAPGRPQLLPLSLFPLSLSHPLWTHLGPHLEARDGACRLCLPVLPVKGRALTHHPQRPGWKGKLRGDRRHRSHCVTCL